MKEAGIGYGAINHPIDRDPCCGYNGIINDELTSLTPAVMVLISALPTLLSIFVDASIRIIHLKIWRRRGGISTTQSKAGRIRSTKTSGLASNIKELRLGFNRPSLF